MYKVDVKWRRVYTNGKRLYFKKKSKECKIVNILNEEVVKDIRL